MPTTNYSMALLRLRPLLLSTSICLMDHGGLDRGPCLLPTIHTLCHTHWMCFYYIMIPSGHITSIPLSIPERDPPLLLSWRVLPLWCLCVEIVKAVWGKFLICENGLHNKITIMGKINWIELNWTCVKNALNIRRVRQRLLYVKGSEVAIKIAVKSWRRWSLFKLLERDAMQAINHWPSSKKRLRRISSHIIWKPIKQILYMNAQYGCNRIRFHLK